MAHSCKPVTNYAVLLRPARRGVQPVVDAARRSWLARLGRALARHQRAIRLLQWAVVAVYLLLVVTPAFLPPPSANARLFNSELGSAVWHERLTLLAQYLFWGIWWPGVILSTLFFGRAWCGLFCPEGALTEFASRHGRGGHIPKLVRWNGWPVVAFIATTLYGQLISVYDYPKAALLILGGSTVAALVVGYLYGRGKRVWCRYLCPVSGVFNLLARIAPLHFQVDGAAWKRYPKPTHLTPAVDCAPLLDVRHLTSAGQCHACGRCAGHRAAVALVARSPNQEILQGPPLSTAEAGLLLFGILGVALGAFTWSLEPAFVAVKQGVSAWLIDQNLLWPLNSDAPWWLLTHSVAAGDLFTWLDGALIGVWIALTALICGGLTGGGVWLAARLVRLDWRALAAGFIPLAGVALFLGLTLTSVNHLRAEGATLSWLPSARAALLGLGLLWSWWLGARLLWRQSARRLYASAALTLWSALLVMQGAAWASLFWPPLRLT